MGDTISAWGNSDRLSTEFLSPLYWWRNLRMGSLSRHRAQQRFRKALDQRLQDTSSPTETYSAYEEAIEELIGLALNADELNKAACRVATDPDAIDFPD